jgi:ribosomal protein L18E
MDTKQFEDERAKEDGSILMEKIRAIINEVGKDFLSLDGDELNNYRSKLIGYKFYLADYISNLERMSEALKIEAKETKASIWREISDKITKEKGKQASVSEIENEVSMVTKTLLEESMLYETMYHRFKIKLSAMDHAVVAIMQRIKELTNQQYDSRNS